MKKSRANFEYRMGEVDMNKILMIKDKDLGSISVTNDIENVVEDIATHHSIDPTEYFIIYRDSEGRWDGWDPKTHEFYFIGNKAVNLIEQRLNIEF